jgi:hypothetical protein
MVVDRNDPHGTTLKAKKARKAPSSETPKSGRNREVPLSGRLRAHVLEFWGTQPADAPLVSASLLPDYFQRSIFPRLCEKAGIGSRLPSDLRNS